MSASVSAPAFGISVSPLTTYHRGFALAPLQKPGRYGACSFGFEVRHQGLLLHTSAGDYGTAASAEGAARRFVDDALRVFDYALLQAEADA